MSLYNSLHGTNTAEELVLKIINETEPLIPDRYRDAYINEDMEKELQLVVLTRTGGGNRSYHAKANATITKHPLYLFDYDDEFDSTFALWFFKIPEKYSKLVRQVYEKIGRTPTLQEKTDAVVEKIRNSTPSEVRRDYPEVCNVIDDIAKNLDEQVK